MPDSMCNFELNLGSFSASVPAKRSCKLQAAIDDALSELQRRQHAQASLTATRSLQAPPLSPPHPRKRAKKPKTALPSTGRCDEYIHGAQQSSSDVLELLQQAALEIERNDQNDLHKREHGDIVDFVTPQNPTPPVPESAGRRPGRNTPPLGHTSAVSDLVQLSISSNIQAGPAANVLELASTSPTVYGCMSDQPVPVVQPQHMHPQSAFCLVEDPRSASASAGQYEPLINSSAILVSSHQRMQSDFSRSCRLQDLLGDCCSALLGKSHLGAHTRERTTLRTRFACTALWTRRSADREGGWQAALHSSTCGQGSHVHRVNPVLSGYGAEGGAAEHHDCDSRHCFIGVACHTQAGQPRGSTGS